MEKNEFFKDIPSFIGYYQVSNKGNVKSLKRKVRHYSGSYYFIKEKILSKRISGTGHLSVQLAKDGKNKESKIHILMGICFLNYDPKNKENLVMDHKDNIRSNNDLDNLQIITKRLNSSKDKKPLSGFTGVQKRRNSYQAKIVINNKQIALGSFKSGDAANQCYLDKIKEIENDTTGKH